ncbi:MAG: MobF family relaxase [Sporichthyaceae bacterium]
MAYVSRIGPSVAQVEYRLVQGVGCGIPAHAPDRGAESGDAQVDYRSAGERPLRWIGSGCFDYGVVEGAAFTEEDLDRARALMDGVDWRTGERLVPAKVEVAPAAKVRGAPLLDAVEECADLRGLEPLELFESERMRSAYRRLARGVDSYGEAYAMHVDLAGSLADAAGIDVLATWGEEFTHALAHREERIDVRNRGYDLVQTLPKSFSVLLAYAPAELAKELEEQVFDVAAHDTLRYAESVASYAMRGHHGHGRSAARMESSGFVGWSLVHRTSRSGDPHHHVHLTVANLVRGHDGRWSAVAAGGRDLMRHAHAMGAFMEARTRHLLRDRYGIVTARSERTGQWEIVGIPDSTLRLFGKRDNEIRTFLKVLGLTWDEASDGERRAARDATRDAKDPTLQATDDDALRARWQAEGRANGDNPARVVAAVLAGRDGMVDAAGVDVAAVAERVFDAETGLTADRKSFDRAAAFAAVLEQLPHGVPDLAGADRIVDTVLQGAAQVVSLPPKGPRHMSDVDRHTTVDLVVAEQAILAAAHARRNEGAALVAMATAEMALATYETSRGHVLSEEQRLAYFRLVNAGNGIEALIGVAGSGKTSIMEAARLAWESAGYAVTGTAVAAVAAQNLQAETGIPSRTVAGLLHGGATVGSVLVVDEAAMVDDRQMAALLALATRDGTKVVGIGDLKQLRAAGVGGSFLHIHAAVDGVTLTQNRRHRDPAEVAITALVREGERALALQTWTDRSRVHVADGRAESLAALVLAWRHERLAYGDPHARLREVLMIAYSNADVAALNAGARGLLQANGELPTFERRYRLANGDRLGLAVGDVVRVRQNLWIHTGRESDLLNGHRGVVAEIRDDGRVVVQLRGANGEALRDSLVSPAEIAQGALCHGYAITDHAAQGQTADVALVYPVGMNANAFYAAVTRHRDRVHLFVPLDQVEDDLTRRRLGDIRTDDERIVRAAAGLARNIRAVPEEMVSLELSGETSRTPDEARAHSALLTILGSDLAERVSNAPEAVALVRVLDQLEKDGGDVAAALTAAAGERELSSARSPAAVLAHRLMAGTGPSVPGSIPGGRDAVPTQLELPSTDLAPLRLVVRAATDFYTSQPMAAWVPQYLSARGLIPSDLPPGTGYAPAGWTALVDHLQAQGFSDVDLLASGVAARSSRGTLIDRMRDRLVLPICDDVGPVAFIGRIEQEGHAAPSWLNTAETPLYRKGSMLYGLAENGDALRAGATPVLVEGPIDAAAVTAAGDGRYVGVAPLGTALTAEQAAALRELVGNNRSTVVGFDNDDAGRRAAVRAYDLFAGTQAAQLRRLDLPGGADPAEVLANEGPTSLRDRLHAATPLIDHVVESKIEKWSAQMQWAEGRVAALREVAPLIAALPAEAATRQIGRIMARLDLPHETVLDAVVEALPRASKRHEIAPLNAFRSGVRPGIDRPSKVRSRSSAVDTSPHHDGPSVDL